MTMKHAIAFSLTLAVAGAMPPGASAQFDLDLQATEITNQIQQIANRVTRYTTLLNQFTNFDCSAQGMAAGAQATPVDEAAVVCDTLNMIGAFKDSYQQLLAAPTDLLNTPVPLPDWRDVLQAADTVTAADIRNIYQSGPNAADPAVATFERRRDYADRSVVLSHAQADAAAALSGGTSFSESWRDVLQQADTVSAADIRTIYQVGPHAADAAAATFERQRDYADRSVVLSHARADAAASLAATAAEVQDKIDTVARENNVSDTALQQAVLAGNLSQGQLLAAMAQMEAWDASSAAAEAYNAELMRREIEARRLAERAALEAQWAQQQAALALGAGARIESMYGGYRLHPVFAGN